MFARTFLLSLAIGACVPPALAGEGHSHGRKPSYGGVIAEVRGIGYELVAKSESLTLYIVDHGKPVSTSGARASATIFAGNGSSTAALEPAGDNKMVAKGSFRTGVGVRVRIAVTLPGKMEARPIFNLK